MVVNISSNTTKLTIKCASSGDSLNCIMTAKMEGKCEESENQDVEWDDLDETELLRVVEDMQETTPSKRKNELGANKNSPNKKQKPYHRRHDTSLPPLTRFRRGYLWVSDLSSQSWCEQQMEYNFVPPVEMEVVEKPVMTTGSNLHLARELEVHDIIKIEVTSDEDILAIKVLNLLGAVTNLLAGIQVCREIPIFGAPFGKGVFMMGMIDEIRGDPETFNFDILEFKTRQTNSFPSKAQKKTHAIQVMVYKKLFDDIILGVTNKDLLIEHLGVDMNAELGKGVAQEVKKASLSVQTLGELLDFTFDRVKSFPKISQLLVEYCYQEKGTTIGIESVPYDNVWLKEKFETFVDYWQGTRRAIGVDIEDAWKCHRCDFVDVCKWRKQKEEECRKNNNRKCR